LVGNQPKPSFATGIQGGGGRSKSLYKSINHKSNTILLILVSGDDHIM